MPSTRSTRLSCQPRPLVLAGPEVVIHNGFRTGEAKDAFGLGWIAWGVDVPDGVQATLRRNATPRLNERPSVPLKITHAGLDEYEFVTDRGHRLLLAGVLTSRRDFSSAEVIESDTAVAVVAVRSDAGFRGWHTARDTGIVWSPSFAGPLARVGWSIPAAALFRSPPPARGPPPPPCLQAPLGAVARRRVLIEAAADRRTSPRNRPATSYRSSGGARDRRPDQGALCSWAHPPISSGTPRSSSASC
jgi:hypothetical protein